MNNQKLTELSAKAVGIVGTWHHGGFVAYSGWSRGTFDPLNDDGDALRLAVALGMTACTDGGLYVSAGFVFSGGPLHTQSIEDAGGRLEAVRLSITSAAAQIGEGME